MALRIGGFMECVGPQQQQPGARYRRRADLPRLGAQVGAQVGTSILMYAKDPRAWSRRQCA